MCSADNIVFVSTDKVHSPAVFEIGLHLHYGRSFQARRHSGITVRVKRGVVTQESMNVRDDEYRGSFLWHNEFLLSTSAAKRYIGWTTLRAVLMKLKGMVQNRVMIGNGELTSLTRRKRL